MDPHILVITDPFDGRLPQGVQSYVRQHRLPWSLHVIDKHEWKRGVGDWQGLQAYDGIIGYFDSAGPMPEWYRQHPVPIAGLGKQLESLAPIYHLIWDGEAIGRLAARHFAEQGFSSVGYLVRGNEPAYWQRRMVAFAEESRRLGLHVQTYQDSPTVSAEDAYAARVQWLESQNQPLGLFFYQDSAALWFCKFCQTYSISIPDQVGVLGVDDTRKAQMATPAISSVHLPTASVGMTLALQLHRMLFGERNSAGGSGVVQPLHVSQRQSTELRATQDAIVEKLRVRMEHSPEQEHVVAAMAAEVGLSVSQLRLRFSRAIGMAPNICLSRCRLQKAKQLLATTDMPVTKIARQCGFRTANGLRKLFKRWDMQTPSIWRALQRGELSALHDAGCE